MSCEKIQELMPEVAAGTALPTPEMSSHLKACGECEKTLKAMQATMAMLDEWKAPAPSAYFDTRLQARLREERERKVGVWAAALQWFKRPAFGVAAVALLALGAAFVSGDPSWPTLKQNDTKMVISAKGTAVNDLQVLDKQSDLLQDLDTLDSNPDDNTPQVN